MIVVLALILVVLISAAAIGHQLEKAPEGFEDHRGFHFVTRDVSAANIRVSDAGALAASSERHAVASAH
jgi:ABC-type molybdate transport system substrate-binding protein